MKYIHLPTLLFHAALNLFGVLTINHYPGTFLPIAIVLLIAHAVWYACSKHNMLPAHLLGCTAQFALYQFGIIDVNSGAFGLGGGEFALFFYEIALTISCAAELVIALAMRMRTDQ